MRYRTALIALGLMVHAACEPPPRGGSIASSDTELAADSTDTASVAPASPAVPAAPVPQAPRPSLTATSTLATWPDSAGLPRLHIVNHRYLVHRGPGEQRAIIEETTTRYCCLGGERDDSATIALKRYATPGGAPTWDASLRADDGAFWREFYRAARHASGDGTDALQFVHVATGRTVFTHSREPGVDGDALPSVHHFGSTTVRYVAFHDRHTPVNPVEPARDTGLIGILQFGAPDGPVARVAVRRARGRGGDFRLHGLEFGRADWHGRDLEVPAGTARSAAEAMTGFSIRVVLAITGEDSLRVVEIPVARDRLRPDQATVPPGLVVRGVP